MTIIETATQAPCARAAALGRRTFTGGIAHAVLVALTLCACGGGGGGQSGGSGTGGGAPGGATSAGPATGGATAASSSGGATGTGGGPVTPAPGGNGGAAVSGGAGGGRSDAGAPAAPDASAAAAPCPPNALVCEGFESGNLAAWTSMPAGGTLTIDTTHVFGGRSALSIDIPANQRGGFLERKGAPLFPLPNGVMYGRLMVYFDSVPDGHTDFVRGAAANGATPWYNVGEQHGQVMLNYYSGAAHDCWARPSPGQVVPTKTWMCWEWSFTGPANEMQLWIDGQLSRRVDMVGDGCVTGGNATWVAPDFTSLRIGEYIAEISSTPARMWIDDIAVGTEGRVGCPAATP